MRWSYRNGGQTYEVAVERLTDGVFRVTVNGSVLEFSAERRGAAIDCMTREGNLVRAWVSREAGLRFVSAPGVGEAVLEKLDGRRAESAGSDGHGAEISSPMPGRVVRLLVAVGDSVKRGQPLLVIEAMKTELTLAAPRDGRVASIAVAVGEKCGAGAALIEIAAAAPDALPPD